MASIKREILEPQIQRRVRPRRDTSEESDLVPNDSSYLVQEERTQRKGNCSEQDSRDKSEGCKDIVADEAESSSESESELVSSISFGALAKAQANLQLPPKHRAKPGLGENHMNVTGKDDAWQDNEALEHKAGRKDRQGFTRVSKHAPAEISSKKAVSRKREVVPVLKREYRDPRFEPLSGPLDKKKLQKAYSFLDDYREGEMKELKSGIKKAKDEVEIERLKRALLSMESRKKAQERKRKEAEILDWHRKEEKKLVKQGKKPFYLKKAEQRKRLLVDRFSELKGKQLDRVLERRRKKVEGKEKKKLPWSRRAVEEQTR